MAWVYALDNACCRRNLLYAFFIYCEKTPMLVFAGLKILKKSESILMTMPATMVTGFGIGVFLTPNKIVGGGASGISTILLHTLSLPPV